MPGLLIVLDDNNNPRVQAHAGAALVNFSEDCPKTILAPYLDPLIAKLEQVLTVKFKEVGSECVCCTTDGCNWNLLKERHIIAEWSYDYLDIYSYITT